VAGPAKRSATLFFVSMRMKMKLLRFRFVMVVGLLSCLPVFLQAQVINTEQKRAFQKQDGWVGSADLGFGLTKNVKTILQAGSRITAQYHKNKHTLLLLNDLNLLKIDSSSIQNSGFQHVRYNYAVRKFLIPEAFVQAQYNQVWKLDLRFLVGAGPRFQLLKNDSNRVFMGALAMYEFERVNGQARPNRDFRLSTYFSMGFGLNKNLTFESITYYQPLFRKFKDFRVSSETSLRIAFTKHLGFKTSFQLNFDSRPPDGLTRMFYSFQNGLTFKF
jgi:putative salt-induced outer membrane protein YdiY